MSDNTDFQYDVFLSYSSKDKAVVRDVAERLKKDGLRVWFDGWEIKPRATKAVRAKKIEEGLDQSCALVLCMSANAFGSGWAQLESGTFHFRDPLNVAQASRLLFAKRPLFFKCRRDACATNNVTYGQCSTSLFFQKQLPVRYGLLKPFKS